MCKYMMLFLKRETKAASPIFIVFHVEDSIADKLGHADFAG